MKRKSTGFAWRALAGASMSEALTRWLADRQAIAFVMLLVSLVLVRSLDMIDGTQFMTGWLALGGIYLGSEFFKQRAAP